jgi:hypothetical protein
MYTLSIRKKIFIQILFFTSLFFLSVLGASAASTYETNTPVVKEGILYYKQANNQSLIYLKEDSGAVHRIINIPEWNFFNDNVGNRVRVAGFVVKDGNTNGYAGIRATGPAGILSPYNTLRYEGDRSSVIQTNIISRHLANLPSQLSTSGFPLQYQLFLAFLLLLTVFFYRTFFKKQSLYSFPVNNLYSAA